MRTLCVMAILLICGPMLAGQRGVAQTGAQHGIQKGDLDTKCDPCTDFAQYANGTWHAENPIPAYMERWSRRWKAGEEAKDQLKVILDEVSSRTDWPKGSVEQLIGDYFGSCMDEPQINKQGLEPAEPMLKQIRAMKTTTDLRGLILRFHENGIFVPFGLVAQPDYHNPTETIAVVFASGLGLPDRDYYLKPEDRFKEAREKYREHVTSMFKLAGYGRESAQSAAETVFRMEEKLAENSLDNVALRDPANTDHKMSYPAFTKLAPSMDWDSYFAAAKISRVDLNVSEPKFMAEFERQLHETSLEGWKTYLTWQLLNAKADTLSEGFVKENFAFYGKYLSGATEIKPRWKRCAESTDRLLGEALGKKYAEKYFPPEAKARAQEMVANIIAAMHDTIGGLTWMGPDTKTKALEKLGALNVKIGYPDKWKDYSSIKLNRDSFWNNQEAAERWNVTDDTWSRIGKPTDRGRWGMTPPTSNAYYSADLNEIVFPAGILQPPSFDINATDAVNYGSIGVVIGHEISHGFDDEGAKFDAQGRLKDWWTAEDKKRFEEKTSCVARQFEGYFIEPNIHHNGKLVLGESIGDLAGAKIAYLGFQKAKAKHPAPTLDGFTPDQQFFIAWGQWRGDEIRPATQRRMIQGDEHPVAKYRVIGPLSNLPVFAETFGCKKDSAMVRPAGERCEVW